MLGRGFSPAFVVAVGSVVLSLGAGTAAATPGEGDVTRSDLAAGETDAPISIVTDAGQPTTVLVQSLLLAPGAHSGWHTHPGPEYSVITGGAVALETAQQCAAVHYGQGQVVFIPAGIPHRVDNDGAIDASVVVNYTLPANAAVRTDSPDVCQG
jgi:quercetin dioxygenase-like cupin family protein